MTDSDTRVRTSYLYCMCAPGRSGHETTCTPYPNPYRTSVSSTSAIAVTARRHNERAYRQIRVQIQYRCFGICYG
eukprot:scaffold174725_cov20-Prasinocladus_malaysianus.AAC.1